MLASHDRTSSDFLFSRHGLQTVIPEWSFGPNENPKLMTSPNLSFPLRELGQKVFLLSRRNTAIVNQGSYHLSSVSVSSVHNKGHPFLRVVLHLWTSKNGDLYAFSLSEAAPNANDNESNQASRSPKSRVIWVSGRRQQPREDALL